jgi:PfaD family protein
MPFKLFDQRHIGWLSPENDVPQTGDGALKTAIINVKRPIYLIDADGHPAICQNGTLTLGGEKPAAKKVCRVHAYAPPLNPSDLGDPVFRRTHGLSYPYIAGAMANGISSVTLVEKMGRAGMLAFFGAAGLLPHDIEAAIHSLSKRLSGHPYGFNLIHSPFDPALERATVDLYLKHGVQLVSASAFLGLTMPLLQFRLRGIHLDSEGHVVCPNKIIAKVSREEVAQKFLSPPPGKMLQELVHQGLLTADEARLAETIPVAEDLTAEADSGGHTDNQPAFTLLPTMLALRNKICAQHRYDKRPCVGLGGGIATPESVSAAFAMGAAYVLTGTINQACVEAGTSEVVRRMLAEAGQADVTMAPAADMFEMGVKVQVLKRGTMFPQRAAKLFELYNTYDNWERLPSDQRRLLEKDFFHRSFPEEWEHTKIFFWERDPGQITRAQNNPRHKMALVFRSYLGRSSGWANAGDPSRQIDYQIWCGPAIGAFNRWALGSFLEKPENREVVTVAMNLLLGSAVATRINWLRIQGITLPADVTVFRPLKLAKILELLR